MEHINEGKTNTFDCRAKDNRLLVLTAIYGTKDVGKEPCYQDVLLKARSLCHQKKSCTFTPSNALFGSDPCPGQRKKLSLKYYCQTVYAGEKLVYTIQSI